MREEPREKSRNYGGSATYGKSGKITGYNESVAYDIRLFDDDYGKQSKSYADSQKNRQAAKVQNNRSSAAPKLQPKRKEAAPQQSPRKKAEIVKIPQKELDKVRRRHHNPFLVAGGFFTITIAAFVMGMIIFGYAQVTELNQKISTAEATLAENKSYTTQLEMKLQAKDTPNALENYAQDELGMIKESNAQQEQIVLSQGDKAQIMETQGDDIFSRIGAAFSELWN
ncbi:MAG: hypothetical protein LBM65_06340 [Oscillospiraceae bacterium]|jgi:cell division protein FtsB|nr:hypothetical protein [Oscillospiraceae bacterium]